jgi:hypothetical protein
MGVNGPFLRKSQFPFPFPFINFFMSELQLQFPFPFVSCNSGNQLTEWGQLLISDLQEKIMNQKRNFEKNQKRRRKSIFWCFFKRNENHFLTFFKTNMHDPHKYLFRPKCHPPTLVSESKEPMNFYQFSGKKSFLKIEKTIFCLNFSLFKVE